MDPPLPRYATYRELNQWNTSPLADAILDKCAELDSMHADLRLAIQHLGALSELARTMERAGKSKGNGPAPTGPSLGNSSR